MPRTIDLPCEELRRRYGAGESTIALARRFRCSPTTIARHLRICGGALRPARFQPVVIPRALLRRLYLDERRPIAAIAAYFGVAPSTIGNKRRRYAIPVRSRRVTQTDGPHAGA